jgi:hypothetical protein
MELELFVLKEQLTLAMVGRVTPLLLPPGPVDLRPKLRWEEIPDIVLILSEVDPPEML